MRYTTAILALAGSAIATPHFSRPKPAEYKEVQNVHVVYETVIHTVYATEGYEASVANLAATSLDSDNVFADGVSLQMATVTGSVDEGLAVSLNVPV